MTIAENYQLSAKEYHPLSRHTSKLKRTPPIGAPNATDIPAAAAAERTSRFLATVVNIRERQKVYQHTYLHFGSGSQMVA